MAEAVKLKILRVKEGDKMVRPACMNGFVPDKIPGDGFVVRLAEGSGMSMYVRDVDLQNAISARGDRSCPVSIDAISWGGKND